MCGIIAYKNFSTRNSLKDSLSIAIQSLGQRGPDNQASFFDKSVGLGHTRLSILDTSSRAHQPMSDPSGRYVLIFNGEIYNYQDLKDQLDAPLTTNSDTEVLLHLLIKKGEKCLHELNGFFAFSFYDTEEETLLIGRDRMGIKPLHYYLSEDFMAFGSEMKALLQFPIPREINHQSLYWYLRLTYLPRDMSMINGVNKLLPGHYIKVNGTDVTIDKYWSMDDTKSSRFDYQDSKKQIVSLLEKSVESRMIADVPLGAFLSGGTDSSAVVSMASKFNTNLNTFSIGYRDHSFFDETHYAELVAAKFKTNHTTFSLTNNDLLDSLPNVLEYLDEPFADSSAIPTYILSQKVSKSMKVALSGDGADELFGGYYKHYAFVQSEKSSLPNFTIKALNPLLARLPKSRSSSLSNTIRRLHKYSDLLKLNGHAKYWYLASFNNEVNELLKTTIHDSEINQLINSLDFKKGFDFSHFLDLDLKVVLPGDMLTKVDLMSMANSLEVRVPFLDKDLVSFARSLPDNFKVHGTKRKRILQDAFEHILPKELHYRSKKGFEVPMLDWLRNELTNELNKTLFNREFLDEQNLFNAEKIFQMKEQLNASSPGDVHIKIWSLFVFQKWYNRYIQ